MLTSDSADRLVSNGRTAMSVIIAAFASYGASVMYTAKVRVM